MNLPPGQYGDVLNPGDVDLGVWDASTHIFTSGATNPDAVRVKLQSTLGNGNPVLTNFLRITGWDSWDVTTYAIAQRFIPGCFTDGLVARGFVDTSSGNAYFNNFCVHGQQGVYLQSNNYFETGTSVSMPDIGLLQLPASGMVGNPGLPDALRESRLNPRMVDHVPQIIAMMLDPTSSVIPDFIDSSLPVIEVDWKFSLNDSVEGRIYHVICPSGKNFGIPSQKVVSKVIVVADCQIGVPAGAVMEDVILASKDTASNDGANIHFSSNVTLGKRDNCADGGGVQIFH